MCARKLARFIKYYQNYMRLEKVEFYPCCSLTGAGVRAVKLADKMRPLISLFSVLTNRLAWVWCSSVRGAEQYPCVQLRH